jgi:glucose/mannose-6-phosphate isomerase
MTIDDIRRLDPSGMYDLLANFPHQVEEAIAIGTAARLPVRTRGIDAIVLCGLGGSAIGGDLLRSYLADELRVPFLVNRHYTLPAFVGPKTLVIISSYSGNTEETNTAHRLARKKHARLLCISTDGTTEQLAHKGKSAYIKIPAGLQPRAAVGYSFFPLLIALQRLGVIRNKTREIKETVALLRTLAQRYAVPENNPALDLAAKLKDRVAVIYSGPERFDAVNVRWRGQIAENGKSLAFGHVFPEMNHNELVGWSVLRQQMREMQVLLLRDAGDHARVKIRMDITRQILSNHTGHITEVWSEGRSPLARMFSLIALGDWVSLYLAILNQVDPTPVDVIARLKNELARV